MKEDRRTKKIKDQASRFKSRAHKAFTDDKRHDRIRRDEQKAMWVAHSQLGWSFGKIGSSFGRDRRTAKRAIENYRPNGESLHKEKMPERVRLERHYDDLAQLAEVVAHQVFRLLRYRSDDNVEALGNIVEGLSFWDKRTGQPVSENIDPLEEFEYEKAHPIDRYLAGCLLAHYKGKFKGLPFTAWEKVSMANVNQELLDNLKLLQYSQAFELTPDCPVCRALGAG